MRYPGGAAQVCLPAAVLCGSPVTVCPYPMSTAGGLLLWLCVLSILFICGDLCVQSFLCVRVLVFHLGGVVFGGSVTGSQTCLVIVACHCDDNCPWHCDILLLVIYP